MSGSSKFKVLKYDTNIKIYGRRSACPFCFRKQWPSAIDCRFSMWCVSGPNFRYNCDGIRFERKRFGFVQLEAWVQHVLCCLLCLSKCAELIGWLKVNREINWAVTISWRLKIAVRVVVTTRLNSSRFGCSVWWWRMNSPPMDPYFLCSNFTILERCNCESVTYGPSVKQADKLKFWHRVEMSPASVLMRLCCASCLPRLRTELSFLRN